MRLSPDESCHDRGELYRALLAVSPDGIIMQDMAGRVFECNRIAEELLERCQDDMSEMVDMFNSLHVVNEDGTPFPETEYPMSVAATVRRSSGPVVMGLIRSDGLRCWLEVISSPIWIHHEQEFLGVATFLRDITERKDSERALEKHHAELAAYHHKLEQRILKRSAQLEFTLGQLKLAVSTSNTGLWSWDLRTGQLYFSPEWKKQIGYSDQQISNTMDTWVSRIHAEDRERALTQTKDYLTTPKDAFLSEYRMQHRDGSFRWILSRMMAVLDEHGKPVLLQGSHIDITERKESEENLLELTRELRDVSRELTRVEEAERRRFAQELHDTIGAALAVLSINMTIMTGQLASNSITGMAARLKDSISLLDDTTDVVRRLMAELRPPVLDDYGLEAALRWQCELFAERCDFRFTVDVYGIADRLEGELEISLFRIAQGAITNIAKYARASNVEVILNIQKNTVMMTITDDGVGFVPHQPRDHRKKPTWGLVSMRERAQALGGSLKIIAEPGKGTSIEVTVAL